MEISGKEFKLRYPDSKLFKLLNRNENHCGFQYKEGLNEDLGIKSFKCQKGGLCFTDLKNLQLWLHCTRNMKYIRDVELLDDSIVYIDKNRFKTNKFILGKERKLIKDYLKEVKIE